MMLKGHAHVYGNSINTDLIIAGKYTKTLNMKDLADHCLEDLDADFVSRVQEGDFVVAGENFGCGSSREQAPLALKYAGVRAVLAKSFARIFYRNAINVGVSLIICDTDGIRTGDEIAINEQNSCLVVNGDRHIQYQVLPEMMRAILDEGGLAPFLKKNGDFVLQIHYTRS